MAEKLQEEIKELKEYLGKLDEKISQVDPNNKPLIELYTKQWEGWNSRLIQKEAQLAAATGPVSNQAAAAAGGTTSSAAIQRERNEQLEKAKHVITQPVLWREAVESSSGPSKENPDDWKLSDTDVKIGTSYEGVPKFPCHRANKLHQLLKIIASSRFRTALITGPPQSGKSAMAQLFKGYVAYAKNKLGDKLKDLVVFYFTFLGYKDKAYDKSLGLTKHQALEKSLDDFFQSIYDISLDDFRKYIVSNDNCIVILDESQMVYHHKTHFWNLFKSYDTGTCSIVAFAAYTMPKASSCEMEALNDSTPSQLKTKLSYAFLAFTESEFNMVVNTYVNKMLNEPSVNKEAASQSKSSESVCKSVSDYIKKLVISPKISDGIPKPDEQVRQTFHPGLTYAILETLSCSNNAFEAFPDEAALYEELENGSTRCLAAFDAIEAGFVRLDKGNTDLKFFWRRFREILLQLLYEDTVNLAQLRQLEPYVDVYRELLVRYVLCCSTPGDDTSVHLSCELVRMHFRVQSLEHSWRAEQRMHKDETIESYIKTVVGNFSSNFPTAARGQDGRLLERAYQDQFLLQAHPFQDFKITTAPQCKSKKAINRGGIKSPKEIEVINSIDFYVDCDLNWGIELTRDSDRLSEHVKRFGPDGKYANLKCSQYCVLDCIQLVKGKITDTSVNQYKKLTQDQANKVLIAAFSNDCKMVTFQKAKIVGETVTFK